MPKVVNLSDAKKQLGSLLERVAGGEEILIAKRGAPIAKLVPVPVPSRSKGRRKPSNLLRLTYMADDFDAPWVLIPESELCCKKKDK